MNEFLANLYGTAQDVGASTGDDTEKLAQAQILDQMFEAEGINIDELHPQTVVKVAEAIFGDETKIAEEDVENAQHEGGESKKEEKKEEAKEDEKKEAEEKLAEADFLGRVMAHSFENERREIEKQAGLGDKITRGGKAVWEGLKGAATGKNIKAGLSELEKSKGLAASAEKTKTVGQTASRIAEGTKSRIVRQKAEGVASRAGERAGKALQESAAARSGGRKTLAKGVAQTAGLYGAGATALGGAGYAAGHHGAKKESALDVLAEQRAAEILSEYGVNEATGEEKLASAVEQRAWEMLAEAGYTVEE